jgi:hypothetical protein
MPVYSAAQLKELEENFPRVHAGLLGSYGKAVIFGQSRLQNEDARRYMLQGVARRLGLIRHCTARIFDTYPPQQLTPLSRDELEDVNVHLHAFVLHVNALQDNLAWSYTHEFKLAIDRHDVSLFRKRMAKHLPNAVQAYIADAEVQRWHTQYSTEFRDALAHRIPLYVPPSQLTTSEGEKAGQLQKIFNAAVEKQDIEAVIAAQDEINRLGRACPYFMFESEQQIILHPQVLCDCLTATELLNVVLDNWPQS